MGRPWRIKSGVGWQLVRGDGETRTPDPLRAKQVLSQLSYIPRLAVRPERGPLWTRTTDLTVISRALLPPELKAPGARAAQAAPPATRVGEHVGLAVQGARSRRADRARSSLTPEAWRD